MSRCNWSINSAGLEKVRVVANPFVEVHHQSGAIKIPLKADEVNLDFGDAFAKGRVGADVGGAVPGSAFVEHTHGINAAARDKRGYVDADSPWESQVIGRAFGPVPTTPIRR